MIRDIPSTPRWARKNMGAPPMPPQVSSRPAFTLIEILVVLTIIIIIALSAMPAIRFIMGSRSIEGTQNMAAAMIGRARSQALADNEQRGVFFFVDPVNDRTTMALVGLGGGDLDQYHGWTMVSPPRNPAAPEPIDVPANNPALPPGGFQYFQNGVPNETQASIIIITNNFSAGYADAYSNYLGIPRQVIRNYICIKTNKPSNNSPGNRPNTPPGNTLWAASGIDLQLVNGSDFQILPQGVGVQLINSNPTGQANFDRYLRIGCIMFDKNGRFESVPWKIGWSTPLGIAMHLAPNMDLDLTTPTGIQPLYSQFGLVLYDRQSFLAQTSSPGNNFTEGDWIFSPNYQGKNFFQIPPKFAASPTDELGAFPNEEGWLDANSLPLLIDRYNGTLIKGE